MSSQIIAIINALDSSSFKSVLEACAARRQKEVKEGVSRLRAHLPFSFVKTVKGASENGLQEIMNNLHRRFPMEDPEVLTELVVEAKAFDHNFKLNPEDM